MKKLGRGGCLLAALLAAGYAIGAESWPAPTGPFTVGRTQFDWTDESRPDVDNPKGNRELIVWVWYPAAPKAGAKPAQWMPGKWGELFWDEFLKRYPDAAEKGGLHPVQELRTHAYADAPVAKGLQKAPVLLFAPGKGDVPLKYSNLIEEIVSHGYVVAGIVPTGDCGFTVFADGRVVLDKPASHPQPGADAARFREQIDKEMADGIRTWSTDLKFTLNQLEKLDADAHSLLRGHLDLKRVGAFGHSQGGAASLQLAKDDARVAAVFDLDGMLSPDVADAGALPKPVLVLNSDMIPRQAMANNKLQQYAALLRNAKPGYHFRLAGSVHYFSADFGLLPFLPESAKAGKGGTPDGVFMNGPPPEGGMRKGPPAGGGMSTGGPPPGGTLRLSPGGMRPMPLVGSIDPVRALTITKAYVIGFFDRFLEGKESDLLKGQTANFPEISSEL